LSLSWQECFGAQGIPRILMVCVSVFEVEKIVGALRMVWSASPDLDDDRCVVSVGSVEVDCA